MSDAKRRKVAEDRICYFFSLHRGQHLLMQAEYFVFFCRCVSTLHLFPKFKFQLASFLNFPWSNLSGSHTFLLALRRPRGKKAHCGFNLDDQGTIPCTKIPSGHKRLPICQYLVGINRGTLIFLSPIIFWGDIACTVRFRHPTLPNSQASVPVPYST